MTEVHLKRLVDAKKIPLGCVAINSRSGADDPVTSSVEVWGKEKTRRTTAGICCRQDCPSKIECIAFGYLGHAELIEVL